MKVILSDWKYFFIGENVGWNEQFDVQDVIKWKYITFKIVLQIFQMTLLSPTPCYDKHINAITFY